VEERSRQPAEEEHIEGAPAPPETAPESPAGEERKPEQSTALDMLFREAEVIARNLKESKTRR
jgi:hypothetical protein